MMRGRVGSGANGGVPTDLLVCFPSKAHLGLKPKPICSPSRPGEASKRNGGKGGGGGGGRGQASPLFKNKSIEIDEPTSPKVTCAGQIKVRPKPRPGPRPNSNNKDWLSVVEEIERLHKEKKRPHWSEGLGIKKDIMHFLGALRGIRFDMRCFGSFHGAVDCSSGDEDDEDEEEEEDDHEEEDDEDDDDQDEDKNNSSNSRTIFSKWFMVLEENQCNACKKGEGEEEEEKDVVAPSSSSSSSTLVPPQNALLLMRCRSAPAKGWVIEGDHDEGEKSLDEEESMSSARRLREEEKEKERLILMSYAPDFFKVSTDIAKETWVVGGTMDPLARSRSWRR